MDKPPEKSRGMAVLGKGPGDTPYLARVTTIEKVLMETQTHCPDLLQLDVEGFEWAALKGMGSLRPSVMVLEYDPKHFERTDVSQDDFRQFVSNLGYDLFTVTGDPLRTTGYVPENNMIAIKKEAPQVRWP